MASRGAAGKSRGRGTFRIEPFKHKVEMDPQYAGEAPAERQRRARAAAEGVFARAKAREAAQARATQTACCSNRRVEKAA